MAKLQGKTVLVTGGSIGIGRETVRLLGKDGARVAFTYNHSAKDAEDLVRAMAKDGAPKPIAIQMDVRDLASIRSAVKTAVAELGGLDVLVNNAGIILWKDLREQTPAEVSDQIATNLTGLISMTRECLPHLRGSVVNLASAAGLQGVPTLTTYCATKWGVRGFTQACAEEMPELTFHAVNPGVIATQMNDFQGMPPEKVGEVIVRLVRGEIDVPSGGDVNIWEHVKRG